MISNWKVSLVLAIGVFAASTAAIFTRLSFDIAETYGVGFSLVLAASRLSLASLILLPSSLRLQQIQLNRSSLYYAGLAGVFLALHFASWISSLSYTSIAASTTLVTTNPVWITLLSWIWFKEKPTLLTVIGIGLALLGGVLIGFSDGEVGNAGSNSLLGDFLALVGAWAASFYLLLGREAQRGGLGIGGYVTVAYTTAAIILLPLPLLMNSSYTGYPNEVYLYMLLMALFPQLVGHTSYNWAMRSMSATTVTLIILFEPVSSSLLGYLVFNEVPGLLELMGAVVLLVGVAVATVGTKQQLK